MPAAPITATRNLSPGDCSASTKGPLETLASAATPAAAAEPLRNLRREQPLDMMPSSFHQDYLFAACRIRYRYPQFSQLLPGIKTRSGAKSPLLARSFERVPRPLPARIRRQGHRSYGETRGHERRGSSRAVGGGAAGRGAAVRRSGRENDSGAGDGLRSPWCLRQLARSGRLRTMALPRGWLTVEAAGRLPEPDTSWMDEPWPRTRFTDWMG